MLLSFIVKRGQLLELTSHDRKEGNDEPSEPVFVGIDVSKATLHLAVMD